MSSSVQFSSVPWLNGLLGGHEGQFSRDPVPVFFCRRPLWAVLAWAGTSTLWCCSSGIFSADHGAAHPPRSPVGWFWCHHQLYHHDSQRKTFSIMARHAFCYWRIEPETLVLEHRGENANWPKDALILASKWHQWWSDLQVVCYKPWVKSVARIASKCRISLLCSAKCMKISNVTFPSQFLVCFRLQMAS